MDEEREALELEMEIETTRRGIAYLCDQYNLGKKHGWSESALQSIANDIGSERALLKGLTGGKTA